MLAHVPGAFKIRNSRQNKAINAIGKNPVTFIPPLSVFEAAMDAYWVIRVEPKNRFVCIYVNLAAEPVMGLPRNKIIGKPIGQGLSAGDKARRLNRYQMIVRERKPLRFEDAVKYTVPMNVETTLTPVCDESGTCRYILGSLRDITERVRLENALEEATNREQQRLGREIHEGLGQQLTGLAFLASALAHEAALGHSPTSTDLVTLAEIANRAVKSCRIIARGVSPLTESQGSLVSSLRNIVEQVSASGRDRIAFQANQQAPLTLSWQSLTHLHRITLEALDNALRHAGASEIHVIVDISPSAVRIEVADNGCGFGPAGVPPTGVGIDSMRKRAVAIGADLRIQAGNSGGVSVVCTCQQPRPTDDKKTVRTRDAKAGARRRGRTPE
jgi:PAS domain S-box-containing protein